MTTTPHSTAELREMLEKATPRPWHVREAAYGGFHTHCISLDTAEEDGLGETVGEFGRLVCTRGVSGNDATLIVSAVNSLPSLLEELERVRKALAETSEKLAQTYIEKTAADSDPVLIRARAALGVSP